MASLAARDQENLINAHRTAAASKPLNQNARGGLQPKTPGNRVGKGRIHNENVAAATGKNIVTLQPGAGKGKGKKVDFEGPAAAPVPITPAPRNALAPKTTNAKAKSLGLGLTGGNKEVVVIPRTGHRPPSIRKLKPATEEPSTKLRIPLDADDDFDYPEPEYMPPRGVPLPDFDEDLVVPESLKDMFRDWDPTDVGYDNFMQEWHTPGEDGLTRGQREMAAREEDDRIRELRVDAEIVRNSEIATIFCDCEDQCHSGDEDECQYRKRERGLAEERYQKAIADLRTPQEKQEEERRRQKERQQQQAKTVKAAKAATVKSTKAHSRNVSRTAGPSDAASRRAASALSMKSGDEGEKVFPSKKPSAAPAGNRNYPKPWLVGAKKTAVAALSENDVPDGYAGRHAAATAASRTNMGFSKGRSVSAGLRRGMQPQQQQEQAQKQKAPRKTEAQWLEDMWLDLRRREDQEDLDRIAMGGRHPQEVADETDFVLEFNPDHFRQEDGEDTRDRK